ncbi:uncharacterized protein LOC125130384 [Phacochoerus africanus]|uniref:uncharacterized protein LOC125130384 n=1 Tax=Phacochoerus africanus TaxID=41426 RepID=UPI001FD8A9F4|nr:uncharacterized protein LOC125130384 [Phacochoerus africanus]
MEGPRPWGQGETTEVTTPSIPLNIRRRAPSALSALTPSSEKPPRHESEVEEEANAQAEAQKKKDEAEVQVNLYTVEATGAETRKSQRPGTLVQFVGLHAFCLELVSMDLEQLFAVLIAWTTLRPTLLISKWSLLVFCPGPVTFWTSSVLSCG